MTSYNDVVLPGVTASHVGLPAHVAEALAEVDHHAFVIDPDLADTESFVRRYEWPLSQAANSIVVIGKRGERITTAVCVVLASTKLDVNKMVRNVLDVRKVSFAPMAAAVDAARMEFGSITPFGVPADWPILVDARVTTAGSVVLGGGRRDVKVVVDGAVFTDHPNAVVIDSLAVPR